MKVKDRFVLRSITCLSLALALGCGPTIVTTDNGPRAFTADDYESVYDTWTRSVDLFAWGRMEDVLHATATFESWEFRWSYVVRYASDHSLTDPARDELLRATLDDSTEHHRFVLSLAGADFREQDLTSERTAWRVLLVDDAGRMTSPVAVTRVRHPSAAEQVYFPAISPHRQVFRVVFPVSRADGTKVIADDARTITLRVTGARGRADLEWHLRD